MSYYVNINNEMVYATTRMSPKKRVDSKGSQVKKIIHSLFLGLWLRDTQKGSTQKTE